MKILLISGVAVLSIVGLFLLFSEPSDTTSQQSGSSSEVVLSTFESDIASGTPLIDVRTPEEFNESRIQAALNLPLDTIQAGALPDASKDEKIYLYCRSGNRSAEAKQILEKAGYTSIVDLGGMNEVVALGAKQVN
jgi:rhodanese-related sulfurtransferase